MTNPPVTTIEVAIVGAGPVGMFLGVRLSQLGIKCIVLERRAKPFRHSRSIGIHAPSLRMFEELGLVQALLDCGVKVGSGKAYSGKLCLGELSFASCPAPYNFVLTSPQFETERILEENLEKLNPGGLRRGVVVTAVNPGENDVRLTLRDAASPKPVEIVASLVVGCGGQDSLVRARMGVAYDGGAYEDAFVMGDFRDGTDFGDAARIFLDDRGVVESFPLPGKTRRWVVQTDEMKVHPEEAEFQQWVLERTGTALNSGLTGLLTSFRAQHFLASHFSVGRMLLAGDSAHVMSPIGGQGMNTGWLDAWEAADALKAILRAGEPMEKALAAYDDKARHRAARAIKRAERYMSIGRGSRYPTFRNAVLSFVLRTPLKHRIARTVTMNTL